MIVIAVSPRKFQNCINQISSGLRRAFPILSLVHTAPVYALVRPGSL